MSAIIKGLISQARAGLLPVSDESIEERGWLGDGDLETICSRYLHGDCHDWTLALHDQDPELGIKVIMSQTWGLSHSFVTLPGGDVALDASGLRTVDAILRDWEDLTGMPCEVQNYDRDRLEAWSNPEPEDIEEAIENIEVWVGLAGLTEADLPDCSMDCTPS